MVKLMDCSKCDSQITVMLGELSQGKTEMFYQTRTECNMDKTIPIVKVEESDSFYKWLDFIDENK
jgi:hypothetical protein